MMGRCLQARRLTQREGLPAAWGALYLSAFPAEERRDLRWQSLALADADFFCTELRAAEVFVGLLSYWKPQNGAFLYVEHFALCPERRGQGYGGSALRLLAAQNAPLLLEIEPPADDLTRRRLRFYERNGFRLLSHEHRQLPYQPHYPAVPLCLMAKGEVDDALIGQLEAYLRQRVMRWRDPACYP